MIVIVGAGVTDDGETALADGTVLRGDRVLICAGILTPELFGPLGAPKGYGLPLGSTGRWAFGQEVPDPATVRALFPALSPVGRVDCVTVRAPWLDPGGDGWTVARRGRVVAFVGSNLMKFGPLLGDLLALAVLTDEPPTELALN